MAIGPSRRAHDFVAVFVLTVVSFFLAPGCRLCVHPPFQSGALTLRRLLPLGVDFASTHRSHQKAGKWPFSLLLTTLMSLSPSRPRKSHFGASECVALSPFFLALMQKVPPGSPSSGSIRGNLGRFLKGYHVDRD